MKPRRPIRPISKREAKRLKEYAKVKRRWNATPYGIKRRCAKCGGLASKKPHHWRGRLGSLLCDTRFWVAVCEPCHSWIHNNIEAARELGLISPKKDWNRQPK